jgi:nucleoside-diphosphate-sugar epimerase
VQGDFGNADTLNQVFSRPVDLIFHLASVPGALAEADPELGYEANLLGTLNFFQRAANQAGEKPPRVVFSSSIAVYGSDFPEVIDLDTPPCPATSYGAHKLIAEVMLADLSRRGQLDGVSLRLPGIVARPGSASGFGSAFMSSVMYAVQNGRSYVCPVSPEATSWWLSVSSCVDNLLHAAAMSEPMLRPGFPLPVLHLSLREVVDALGRRFGPERATCVSYEPDDRIERLFGAQPPLSVPGIEALGFTHDRDADELVRRSIG